MSDRFVTSDHHFDHANILKYCERPFANVDEMNQAMIDRWNAVVGPKDTVYYLGDFTLGDLLSPWVHALLFRKLLVIPGNHDHRWMNKFDWDAYGGRVEVFSPIMTLNHPLSGKDRKFIVMCHYPLLSWERSHYGSLHLHGHCHGTVPDGRSGDNLLPPDGSKGRRIDVGVDSWDFAPVSLDALLEDL